MENSEREELDRIMVMSKLGMPTYGIITTTKRSYQVVAVDGVPVELSMFAAIIMRHCSGYGTVSVTIQDATNAFWEDIGYEPPAQEKAVDGWGIPVIQPGVGRLILDALQGIKGFEKKYDKEHDFLPVLKSINEQIRQYVK